MSRRRRRLCRVCMCHAIEPRFFTFPEEKKAKIRLIAKSKAQNRWIRTIKWIFSWLLFMKSCVSIVDNFKWSSCVAIASTQCVFLFVDFGGFSSLFCFFAFLLTASDEVDVGRRRNIYIKCRNSMTKNEKFTLFSCVTFNVSFPISILLVGVLLLLKLRSRIFYFFSFLSMIV